jgi:competence protein ComEC
MRFADFPFLRYLPFLLAGIFVGDMDYLPDLAVLICALILLWAVYFKVISSPRISIQVKFSSILGYVMLLVFGMILTQVKEKSKQENLAILSEATHYVAEVMMYDAQKTNSFENLLQLKSIKTRKGWIDASGKILVYHQNKTPLIPGQFLMVSKVPEQIFPPKNPNEFDYREFLVRKGIFYRQFLGKDFHILQHEQPKYAHAIARLRNVISEMLAEKIPHATSLQIANALLLGQKQNLDPHLQEAYVQAGVIHILAVSGLHVGIIYAIFLFLIKPLDLSKKQKNIYLLGVVGMIWLYAFLTGLSPSVVRSATMFSLVALGQMRDRKPSIYNVLAFSAMLMITFNPDVIFEVGFLLSYIAVLGIVMIQPLIVRWWLPSNRVIEYFWQLTAVSLAAQLATFPLSVYYFHVFPTYFLLANLLVLPLAFVIMQVGVPLMMLGWIPYLGEGLGWVLSWLIQIQNEIAELIYILPGGKLERLVIDFWGMLLVWGTLLIWAGWETAKRKKLAWLALILVFCWSIASLSNVIFAPDIELLVYQGKKGKMFDYYRDGNLYSWNQGMEADEISFVVDPRRIVERRAHFPFGFSAGKKGDNNFLFPFHSISYSESQNRLYFAEQKPKSIQIWEGKEWADQELADSIDLGETAVRIIF